MMTRLLACVCEYLYVCVLLRRGSFAHQAAPIKALANGILQPTHASVQTFAVGQVSFVLKQRDHKRLHGFQGNIQLQECLGQMGWQLASANNNWLSVPHVSARSRQLTDPVSETICFRHPSR